MKRFFYLILSATILFSCGKDAPILHSISSISPTSGTFSTIVTITGSGFSDVPSENIVTFNGKPAVVNTATATQLTVVTPEVAGTGTVDVSINGGKVTGPIFTFQYLFTVSTFAGTVGEVEILDGTGTNAKFRGPYGLALDNDGNLLVGDNTAIRKVTPSGVVSTLAGSIISGDEDGVGANAKLNTAYHVAIGSDGTYYFSQESSSKIKKLTPAGVVTTWIGSAGRGYEDGTSNVAKLADPEDLVFDNQGNLYVAEFSNYTIRKVTPSGVVSTFAGNQAISDNIDGTGTNAAFTSPIGLHLDNDGNIIVGDATGHIIRKITPAGVVSTVSGTGVGGYAEGSANTAQFNRVYGICEGHIGDLVVTDHFNDKIRMIDETGTTTLLAGGSEGFQNGNNLNAQFDNPWGIVYDKERSCYYIADRRNNVIRKILVQ